MKIQKRQEIEFFGTKTGNANSIALGYATETKNFGEVAVGVMNKSTAAKDPNSPKGVCVDSDATLFSVGCGGSGERKNALEVKGDGSVLISGEDGDINVADKIKQALDTDASIELVKSADSDLQYTLMVNNESRGSINIPKDQFLKNVTYDTDAKQLVFTFVTLDEEEHVERISINDLKDVYTAGDGINIDNNVISADFSSVMTAISDEKTQRETTDNEIKSTLDTKADKTDVDNRLDDLSNYCFKLRNDGSVAAPYKAIPNDDSKLNIQTLNNIEEYTYAGMAAYLEPGDTDYIYDKTLDKNIKITTSDDYIPTNKEGDFFRTSESLDLTHTFYLDNEKTGIIENLTQLSIEKSDIFVNLPYVEVDDNLEDDEAPQYIYDATDNKWIEVVENYYTGNYVGFNAEESLDLTHEFYIGIIGNWSSVRERSTVLGCYANSSGVESTALGYFTTVNGNGSICIGYSSKTNGNKSIVLGYSSFSNASNTTILGYNTKADSPATNNIVAIGNNIKVSADNAIAIGKSIELNSGYNIAIGDTAYASIGAIAIGKENHARGGDSVAIGNNTWSVDNYSIGIGYRAKASGLNSLALGATSTTGENYAISIGNAAKAIGHHSIAIGDNAESNFKGCLSIGGYAKGGRNHAIALGTNNSNSKAIFAVGFDGINGIEMDGDNYGLYLKGFGGYDGENLTLFDKENQTESFNPDIKSVQQIINEKADASAIPTKLSQLTNDANFITSYTETDPVWTSEKGNYYTKTEIDGKGYLTEHQSLADYAKKTEIPDVNTKADLVDGKLKVDQLPKLDNIAAATTTEDMITKFNALLTDLKAKGYMTADITA